MQTLSFFLPPLPAVATLPQTFSVFLQTFSCARHAGTPGTNYTALAFYPQNSLPHYGILLFIVTFQAWSRIICISLTIAL